MADNASYPAVGLRVDLDDFRTLDTSIEKSTAAYGKLYDAAEKASKTNLGTSAERSARVQQAATQAQMMSVQRILAAQRGLAAQQAQQDAMTLRTRQTMWRQQAQMAEQAAKAEQAAQAKTTADFRRMMSERISAGRAAGRTQEQLDRQAFEMRRRLTAQQATEADRAQKTELAGFRAMMADRIAAGRAAARDEENQVKQTFEFRRRMAAQQAQEEARAAAQRQAYLAAAASTRARSGSGGVAEEIRTTSNAMDIARGAMARFSNATEGIRNALHRVQVAFFDVRTVVSLLVGGLIVGPIVRFADAMTALQARIGFFADSQRDIPYLFEAVYQTAQRTRAPLEAVATLYTRLAPLAKQLGKSQLELLRITETVQKGIAIGGATGAEATASAQQLAQALASNRLGGDELRSLAENAPILLAAIARELNMNTGEFIKWAHQGKASAEVVVGALEAAAPRIDALFAQFPVTISQGVTVVQNAIQKLVGEVNNATQAGAQIGAALVDFSNFISSPETIAAAAAAVNALGSAFKVLGSGMKLVVDSWPVVAALLGVLAVRAVLATTAVRSIGLAFAASAAIAGPAAATMTAGATAASVAVTRLAAAGRALLAVVGGPLGLAILAAAAAFAIFRANALTAQEAVQKFDDANSQAANAIERAMTVMQTYGADTKGMTQILLDLNGVQEDQVKGLDEAGRVAVARAKNERNLTVALLARAAAEQSAAAASLRRNATLQKGAAFAHDVAGAIQFGSPINRAAHRNAAQEARNAAGFNESLASDLEKNAQASLAAADQLRNATFDVKTPDLLGGGGGLANKANDATKGLDSAINRIAKMAAEVEGLRAQIKALDVSPLSDIKARIDAAGNEAAAQYTSGKAAEAGFAARARGVARLKEELQIRLEMTKALLEQQRAEEEELALAKLTENGRRQSEAILQEYFRTGVGGYQAYVQAVNAAKDAEAQAQVAASNLRIARQYGVTSIQGISKALQEQAGFSKEAADAIQAQAQKTAAAAAANILYANTAAKAADADRERTSALEDYYRQRKALQDLERDANLTPQQRDASERTKALARVLLNQAIEEGVKLTDEEARKLAEQVALLERQREIRAGMKIQIQEAIRDAFIETGKLDFTSLRQAVTRELRRALYDALLAKAITPVVNLIVNVVTEGMDRLIAQIKAMIEAMKAAGSSGQGGILGTIGKALKGLDSWLNKALPKLTSGKGVMGALGNVVAGYQTGAAAADMFGLKGASHKPGQQMAMDLAFSAIGTALGGPIGAAIGTLLSRGLGKAILGKESNYGALATFSGDSFSISGNKRNEQTTAMAEAASTAILNGQKALRDAGISLTDSVKSLDIGTRDRTDIILASGKALTAGVGDAAAAAETALKALLQSATYTDEVQKKLVDSMLATGAAFDDIIAKLKEYAEAQKFFSSVEREILRYTNPKQFEIANLQDAQKARRDQAQAYFTGGLLTQAQFDTLLQQLTQLDQLEMKDLTDRLANTLTPAQEKAYAAVEAAQEALRQAYERERATIQANIDKYRRVSDSLDKFIKTLETGPLSQNSPADQYAITRQQFLDAAALANAGNTDAAEQLPELGKAFLEASQNYSATLTDYLRDFALVRGAIQSAKDSADKQLSIAEQQLAALEAQVSGLIDINGSVLSVGQAIANLQAALTAKAAADKAAEEMNKPQVPANDNNKPPLSNETTTVQDWAGYLAMWQDVAAEYAKLSSTVKGQRALADIGVSSGEQFAQWHYNTFGKNEPGRTVPTKEVPKVLNGDTSINATASANDNSRTNALLAAAVEALEKVVVTNETTAANTGQTARTNQRWDSDGMPEVRDVG